MRGHGRPPGSSSRRLDFACGRRGFRYTMGRDQVAVHAGCEGCRHDGVEPHPTDKIEGREGRCGDLAAAVLGALHSKCPRFRAARPVLLGQSGEARVCAEGRGLAVFVDPSGYQVGAGGTGLGGCRRGG
jgi:hypothetical protein